MVGNRWWPCGLGEYIVECKKDIGGKFESSHTSSKFNYSVFQVACPEEIKKMGVGFVCASIHCCIHLIQQWLLVQTRTTPILLSLLDKQPEIHFRLVV